MTSVPIGAGTGDDGKVTHTDGRLTIRPIQPRDEGQWRGLWKQYLDFYGAEVPDAVTRHTWQRMLGDEPIIGLAAVRRPDLVGFAIAILHEATWSIGRTAYLEDLFVSDDERGRDAGRMLIDEVIRRARGANCNTVYWHTQTNNHVARRLYDSYGRADDFVRYRLSL
jgi:GNAT superfamily N-acetyltransferase